MHGRAMSRDTTAVVLLSLGTVGLAFVAGANLYEQVFCIPSWRTPEGWQAWRTLTEHRNAGVFFLPAAGGGLLCLAAGTALGWNHPAARNPYALAATLAMLAALVLTGAFFVPLNMRLFVRPPSDS